MTIRDDVRARSAADTFDRALDRMAAALSSSASDAGSDVDPEVLRAVLATLDSQDRDVLWHAYVEPVGDAAGPGTRTVPVALRRRVRKAERALALGLAAALATDAAGVAQSCASARGALGEYVRHRLRDARRRAVEEHLLSCTDCVRVFVSVRQARRTLRAAAPLLLAGAGAVIGAGPGAPALLAGVAHAAPEAAGGSLAGAVRDTLVHVLRVILRSPAHSGAIVGAGVVGVLAIATVTAMLVAGVGAAHAEAESAATVVAVPGLEPGPPDDVREGSATLAEDDAPAGGAHTSAGDAEDPGGQEARDLAPWRPRPPATGVRPASPLPGGPSAPAEQDSPSTAAPPAAGGPEIPAMPSDPEAPQDGVPPDEEPGGDVDPGNPDGGDPGPGEPGGAGDPGADAGPGDGGTAVNPDVTDLVTVQVLPTGPQDYWAIELREQPAGEDAYGTRQLLGLLNALNAEPVVTPEGFVIEPSEGDAAPAGTWLIRNESGSSGTLTFRLRSAVSPTVIAVVRHATVWAPVF